jgi:hypothetical protein
MPCQVLASAILAAEDGYTTVKSRTVRSVVGFSGYAATGPAGKRRRDTGALRRSLQGDGTLLKIWILLPTNYARWLKKPMPLVGVCGRGRPALRGSGSTLSRCGSVEDDSTAGRASGIVRVKPGKQASKPGCQAMHRGIRIVVAVAVAVGLAFVASQFHAGPSALPGQTQGIVQSALTKPVEFAKREFTGGVGVMMRMDQTTGLPRVQGVSVGSPADKAGLQSGDLILEVNGVATSGRKLAQVVESIRGFRGGEVSLKIQRVGATNSVECFLRRTSWNNLTNVPFK